MNIQEAILETLTDVQKHFYNGREAYFFRDKQDLLAALSEFGWHCQQRGFYLTADDLRAEVKQVTDSMIRNAGKIQHFPIYLRAALKKTVGQRAEELNAKSKAVDWLANRSLNKLQPKATDEEPPVVTLAKLHFSLKKRIKERTKPANAKQTKLL